MGLIQGFPCQSVGVYVVKYVDTGSDWKHDIKLNIQISRKSLMEGQLKVVKLSGNFAHFPLANACIYNSWSTGAPRPKYKVTSTDFHGFIGKNNILLFAIWIFIVARLNK